MPNAIITLNEEEQLTLEEILMDKDNEASLEFLEKIVKAKIAQSFKGQMKQQYY